MCVNTEEWLHLNFFMRNVEKIATIVVRSKDSAALSRTQELLTHAVRDMGRPTLLVTNGQTQLQAENAEVVKLPPAKYPMTGALSQFIPLALLAGYGGAVLGEKSGRGCVGPWEFAKGGAGLKQSQIIVR